MSKRPSIQVEKIQHYSGHRGSIFALAVDQAERYLYSSGDDGVVARWDLSQKEDSGAGVLSHSSGIYALELAEAQGFLLVGSSDGTLHIVDLHTREIRHQYRRDSQAIYHISVDPQRGLAWILHGKGALSVMDLSDFTIRGSVQLCGENLRCMTMNLTHRVGYIGASDGNIYAIGLDDGKVQFHWLGHEPSVFALEMGLDGQTLLSGGRDAHMSRWRLDKPPVREAHLPAHNFTLNHFARSPDGRHLLTASRDKTIKLWETKNLNLLKVIDYARNEGHRHSVNKIKWLTTDNSVISCGDDRQLFRWQIRIDVP